MRIFFILFLFAFSFSANAATYPKTFSHYETLYDLTTFQDPSYSVLCVNFKNRSNIKYPNDGGYVVSPTSNETTCTITSPSYTLGVSIAKYGLCSGTSLLSLWGDGLCTEPSCVSPQLLNLQTHSCFTPANCQAGQVVEEGPWNVSERPVPLTSCHSNCESEFSGSYAYSLQCSIPGGDGLGLCVPTQNGKYILTGKLCPTASPSPVPPQKPPVPNCPPCRCMEQGGSYGTVNGVSVCVPRGSVGSAPVTSTPPPVVTTTTPAATAQNPNPTPTTTVTPSTPIVVTPPPAGSPENTAPTISTSSKLPDGSNVATIESKTSFCEKNPTSELCASKTDCDKYPDSVACTKSTTFIEDLVGKVSDVPAADTIEQVKAPTQSSFSSFPVPSSNGCPAPLTKVIAGASIVMSFDWLCAYASAFRMLLIAFASMAALAIVSSGVRADSNPYQRGLF